MELAIAAVQAAQKAIEHVAVVVIPFEFLLISVLQRRLGAGDTGVNVTCGIAIGFIYYLCFHFSPMPVFTWLQEQGREALEVNFFIGVVHVLVGDLCFYIFHRLAHTRFFFAIDHSAHHSSRELDFTTNLRNSLVAPLYAWLPLTVPVYLGFNPVLLLASFALANGVPFFCHTRHIGKLGWLEYIFNTPSHHRVHHGRNACYAFKNFGGMLIIWDRLFGTYAEEIEPVKFGIPNIKPKGNLLSVYTAGLSMLRPGATRRFGFTRKD